MSDEEKALVSYGPSPILVSYREFRYREVADRLFAQLFGRLPLSVDLIQPKPVVMQEKK